MQKRPCRKFPFPRLRHLTLACLLAVGASGVAFADARSSQFYEDALQRFEKKDYVGAVVQLKNVLKADNKNLSAQVLLGRALLANGAMGPAEVALNEALRLGVNRVEVVVPLAQSLVGQARLQEIVNDTKFASAGLPDGVKSQLLLMKAAAHSDLSGGRDALKLIEEARALQPTSADSWLAEVHIRIRSRQFKEARAAADRAAALAPTSAEAQYLIGSIAHVQGDTNAALAAYEKTLQMEAAHTEALIARAGLRLDQGLLDEARRDVTEVRRLNPSDPRAPYLAGQIADRKGDAKAARSALAEVTGILDPVPLNFMRYRPQLLILGGLAHFGLGETEKARPYLESMVRQSPESPAAKLLGQIYLGSGDQDRAIETLEAYLRGQPNDQQAVLLLATAQLGKGRASRATQLLQDALKTDDSPRMRTFLGMTLVGGGKRNDALAEFENAFRRDPSQLAAGAALVDLYLGRNQTAKAGEIAESLIKRWPKEAPLHTLAGNARAQAGDVARARAAYDQALKLDPNFLPAQVQLAKLEIQANQLDAAARRLSAVLAKDEKHLDALIELARVAERKGMASEATKYLEKAADHSGPREVRAALLLVEHHLRHGRVDAANQALARVNSKAPDAVPVLLANANVRMAAKDAVQAGSFLTRASRSAGFDPRQLTEIAAQQLAAKDLKGAAFSLNKALQGQPNFTPAEALLVEANLRLGDMAAADQLVRNFLTRSPNGAQAHALKGDVALAKGQVPAAIEAYKRSHQIEPTPYSVRRLYVAHSRQNPDEAAKLVESWLKKNPADADLRRMLADGYARARNFPAAKVAYEALLVLTPGDADVLNNYANVLLLAKDPAALKVAEQALAAKPQSADIVSTVGWAAFQAGQPDRALQLLRDARLRDPNNAETRYFLGAVLAARSRPAEAREELQAALGLNRSFAFAKETEALLQTLR